MAKTLIEAFSEEFFRELKNARNHPEAYERASEKFEQEHKFVAFNDYDSYRRKRDRRKR